MTDLSIIIVNYRGWKRLKQCLDSLSSVDGIHLKFDVIIIDNASNDGVLKNFRDQYQFTFIENAGNNGFANGCNLGARLAKGEVLLFLNPDTIVSEQALYEMLKTLHDRNNCIISCRQIKENGFEEKSYGRFLTPFTLTGWLRAIHKIFDRGKEIRDLKNSGIIFPDWISGSVTMIRKQDFEELGGWDEDFWMYYEDVDFCKRAKVAGKEIILLTNVSVEHNHGGSSRINPSITLLTKTEVFASRHVYISKHSNGILKFYMQTFMVVNNLISGFLFALLGIILFFNVKMRMKVLIFANLLKYYLNSLKNGTWMSPRSVKYRLKC